MNYITQMPGYEEEDTFDNITSAIKSLNQVHECSFKVHSHLRLECTWKPYGCKSSANLEMIGTRVKIKRVTENIYHPNLKFRENLISTLSEQKLVLIRFYESLFEAIHFNKSFDSLGRFCSAYDRIIQPKETYTDVVHQAACPSIQDLFQFYREALKKSNLLVKRIILSLEIAKRPLKDVSMIHLHRIQHVFLDGNSIVRCLKLQKRSRQVFKEEVLKLDQENREILILLSNLRYRHEYRK